MPRKGERTYKGKDGRWEGRYIKSKPVSGGTSYGYCYGKTYKEAKKIWALKKGLCTVGPHRSTDVFEFSKYCSEWLYLHKSKIDELYYVKCLSIIEKA